MTARHLGPNYRSGGCLRFVRKVNDRGVLTLPTEIREALGVEEGDIVEFEVLGVVKKNGRPARTILSPDKFPLEGTQ